MLLAVSANNAWSKTEVQAIVASYFTMLSLELSGTKFSKAEHWRALMERINRSKGSIEYKYQNISALLIDAGKPFIAGYVPYFNYERVLLPEVIAAYLGSNPSVLHLFSDVINAPVVPPAVQLSYENILDSLVEPPVSKNTQPSEAAASKAIMKQAPIDYLAREERNQQLGAAGEKFVLRYERARLLSIGLPDLAPDVEQVSETIGPAAGYDIRSFSNDGSPIFIEVKTTRFGKSTPFFISAGEVNFATKNAEQYRIYRLFSFANEPKLFTLAGSPESSCQLLPTQFRATVC